MSALDLAAIRTGLVERLSTIDGLFVYPQWPGTPQVFPCAVIFPPERVDYSKTSQRGLEMATWQVLVLVGSVSPTSQAFLEGVASGVGSMSVIAALYADRRLGGVASNLRVLSAETGMFALSKTPLSNVSREDVAGVEFTVEVMA